jgi:serine/threonine protein kinase
MALKGRTPIEDRMGERRSQRELLVPKDPLPLNHPKYQKVKDLSTGAFGVVQLCRNKKNGQLVAIKFLERVRC